MEEINISIEAVDENNQTFLWTRSCRGSEPLRHLVALWAKEHEVPLEAVGVEDGDRHILDLDHSASGLGWSAQIGARIFAYPLDTAFAEQQVPSQPSGQQPRKGRPKKLGVPTKHIKPMDSEPSKADRPAKRARAKSPDVSARGTSASVEPNATSCREDAMCAVEPAVGKLQTAAIQQPLAEQASSASSAPCAKVSAQPPQSDKAAPTQKAQGRTSSKSLVADGRYKGFDGAGAPTGEETVVYNQDNPKKVGTEGWTRYEKYKVATTPNEALSLGSAKGDLKHDWMKGFYKRV